jgi:Coenzyme PQQ synthesis protein D (PqqD)
MSNSRIEIASDVESARVEGDYVLMDLKRGLYIGLDPVASHIWQSLCDHGDVTRAVEELCESFDVEPAQALADVEAWIAELERKGLVVVHPARQSD